MKIQNAFSLCYNLLIFIVLKLRNNLLTELPAIGLESHQALKSLLLENNKIRRLPPQISNIRTLTSISLTDNPIEYPPLEVVQKGCKALQQHMRSDYAKIRDLQASTEDRSAEDTPNKPLDNQVLNYDENIAERSEDVWDSDYEEMVENRARSNMRARSAFSRTPDVNYLKKYCIFLNKFLLVTTFS
jgi:hypothetical protein